MGNIKLSQLEMLVAVVECGSFSGASIEMDCTQSRISHGIAELERSLGAQLLVRAKAGCTPTETGQRVIAKARQVLRVAASIAREVQSDASSAGQVRIASIPSVTAHLVPFALEVAAEEFPRIHIDIFDGCKSYCDVLERLKAGEADVGIARVEEHDGIVAKPYVYDRLVAVVPGNAPVPSPLKWSDLTYLPLILQTLPDGDWILQQLRMRGFQQKPAYRMEHESSIITMVARGLGYTVLPRLAVGPEPVAVKLMELPYMIERRLSIVTRFANSPDNAVTTVANLLRDRRVIQRCNAFRFDAVRVDGVAG